MKHTYDIDMELSYCEVCGLFEGSLTTDCSGERVDAEQEEKVYRYKLDYREGEGWVRKFSPVKQMEIYDHLYGMHTGREGCFNSEAELRLFMGATKEDIAELRKRLMKNMYAN